MRIRNWTALDWLHSGGSPCLNVAMLTLQHSLEEAAFGNCLTSSCWEAISFFYTAVMRRVTSSAGTLFASHERFLSQLFCASGLSRYSKSGDAKGANSALFFQHGPLKSSLNRSFPWSFMKPILMWLLPQIKMGSLFTSFAFNRERVFHLEIETCPEGFKCACTQKVSGYSS